MTHGEIETSVRNVVTQAVFAITGTLEEQGCLRLTSGAEHPLHGSRRRLGIPFRGYPESLAVLIVRDKITASRFGYRLMGQQAIEGTFQNGLQTVGMRGPRVLPRLARMAAFTVPVWRRGRQT
jgi:hypothetical protein